MPQPSKYEIFAQEIAKGRTSSEAEALCDVTLMPCHKLDNFYVYLLIDPRDDKVFYVGKGMNRRWSDHIKEWRANIASNSRKFNRIDDIVRAGFEPTAKCLVQGLKEYQALYIERRVIETIGLANLVNFGRGHETKEAKIAAFCRKHLRMLKPYDVWLEGLRNGRYAIGITEEKAIEWYRGLFLELCEGAFQKRYEPNAE